MKLVHIIIKYLVIISTSFIVILFISNNTYILPKHFDNYYIYVICSIVFSLLYFFVIKSKLAFYEVLAHELTHFLFAFLTFKSISVLHVSKDSGLVQYEGKTDFIVLLSPYFFPLITIITVLLTLLLPKSFIIYGNLLVTICYTSFLLRTFRDFSLKQPDILESGRIYSVLFVSLINFITFIFLIHFISGELSGFIELFDLRNIKRMI